MAWQIRIAEGARKEIGKLDRPVARRVVSFLRERLEKMDDPRSIGEALKGKKLEEFWKYGLGDIRIVARIEDGELIVLVVRVGHRRDVYK